MTKDHLIKLTVALYKVTELFPLKEPLKYQIREKANQILADFISANPQITPSKNVFQFLKNLEVLFGYFQIARSQNWINNENLDILENEYKNLQVFYSQLLRQQTKPQKETIKEEPTKEKPKTLAKKAPNFNKGNYSKTSPKERKEKILQLLYHKQKITLSEIRKIFFNVSPRTLRRDMEDLIKKGLIQRKRKGQKDVEYTLIKRT